MSGAAVVRTLARAAASTALAVAAASTVLAVAAGPLGAQDQPTLRLTLSEALRIAEGSNPTVRRAANDALLNGTEMRTTWLERLLPTASLDLYTNFWGNLQRQARDNFGNPIANPAAEWTYFSQTTQRLNLSWNVQGPSLFQAYRRQALVNRGRDLAQAAALTEVQVRVQLLYMDALEQRELMDSEAELLEARRIDREVAERLFSLALRTRVDVLNAELAVEQQALALQQQEAAYRTALLELRAALGLDDERELDLASEQLPLFDPAGLDADRLVALALRGNPELRRSSLAVETAGHGLSEQRSAWWPRLAVGVDVYRRAQAGEGGALFDPAFDQDLESQFFLQLSMPILGGFFGAREASQQAMIELRNEREADREARLETERAVRGAVLALDNQWASLRFAERSREIAEEALRLAREEYRLGTLGFEELRASFDAEAETRRQVITSRHAFVEALLRLEEAVGGPVRPAPASGGGAEPDGDPALGGGAGPAPGPRSR